MYDQTNLRYTESENVMLRFPEEFKRYSKEELTVALAKALNKIAMLEHEAIQARWTDSAQSDELLKRIEIERLNSREQMGS